MKLKNFVAPDMASAFQMVREALGADAVIISQEKDGNGNILITAAIEEPEEIDFDIEDKVEVKPSRVVYDDSLLRECLEYHGVLDVVKERILARTRKIALEENINNDRRLLRECFASMFNYRNLLDLTNPVKMFMGVAGSGKSTAIAKVATQAKLNGIKSCIISTDNVRAGANSQLKAFADILETDFSFIKSSRGLFDAVNAAKENYSLILIDTAGINPFLREEVEKVSLFTEAVKADMILTMDAGKNTYEAVEIADIFTEIGARWLLPTRMDLTRRIGALLSVASCCELNFCSASVSASIAKGLAEIDAKSLADLVLA